MKKKILVITASVILALAIFITTVLISYSYITKERYIEPEISYEDLMQTVESNNTIQEVVSEETVEEQIVDYNWQIEIPKINLIAPIGENTTNAILENYVGHFINSNTWNGNIGLAAHNNTYFKDLKEVKIGDEIIYKQENNERKYVVNLIQKIDSRDWSYLGNTDINTITLITCVKDRPDLRLCVQGIEKQMGLT